MPAPTPPRRTIWMEIFHHFTAAQGQGRAGAPLPTDALPSRPAGLPAPRVRRAGAAGSRKSRGPEAALGDAEASAVPARAGGCPGLARGGMRGRHRGLRWRLFPEQSGFWAETRASERTRLKVKSFGCRYPLFGRSLRLLGCCIKS